MPNTNKYPEVRKPYEKNKKSYRAVVTASDKAEGHAHRRRLARLQRREAKEADLIFQGAVHKSSFILDLLEED